jgi:hypothetical protein
MKLKTLMAKRRQAKRWSQILNKFSTNGVTKLRKLLMELKRKREMTKTQIHDKSWITGSSRWDNLLVSQNSSEARTAEPCTMS